MATGVELGRRIDEFVRELEKVGCLLSMKSETSEEDPIHRVLRPGDGT